MNIIISTNKELDFGITEDFYVRGSSLIQEFWPEIQSKDDIPRLLEKEYGPVLESKVVALKSESAKLHKIANAISLVMNEAWQPINEIHIFIGACPIAPRFLDVHWFLLPYYHDLETQINTAAHEMIHFLYFKKWTYLFGTKDPLAFESPSPIWVLSEILVAVIGNDPRIKDIASSSFDVYPNWQNKKVDGESLVKIFSKIYKEASDFNEFLIKSWKKYQALDRKFNLTKELGENPF